MKEIVCFKTLLRAVMCVMCVHTFVISMYLLTKASLISRPSPCFPSLAVPSSDGKQGEGLGTRLHQSKQVPKLHWDCKFGHVFHPFLLFLCAAHTCSLAILPNDMLPGRERERGFLLLQLSKFTF